MALRWDLRRVAPNLSPDTFPGRITYRSLISAVLAVGGLGVIIVQPIPDWIKLVAALAMVAAFDAGDMAVPFEDEDEPEDPKTVGEHVVRTIRDYENRER